MDDPASRGRRPVRKRRSGQVVRVIRAAVLPVSGVILLSLGISGVHNAHVLATQGVPVIARVTATSGYGRDTFQVGYLAKGKTEHGTIGSTIPFQLGERLPVVYDPQDPSVVAEAGTAGSTTSAWTEVGLGSALLATVPLAFAISMIVTRRRRRRAAGVLTGG